DVVAQEQRRAGGDHLGGRPDGGRENRRQARPTSMPASLAQSRSAGCRKTLRRCAGPPRVKRAAHRRRRDSIGVITYAAGFLPDLRPPAFRRRAKFLIEGRMSQTRVLRGDGPGWAHPGQILISDGAACSTDRGPGGEQFVQGETISCATKQQTS